MTQFMASRRPGSGPGARSGTGFAVTARASANLVTVALLVCCIAGTRGLAGDLSVAVIDRGGHGVASVVVTVIPTERGTPSHTPATATAVMDQRHRAFVPRVLAVATGTQVDFPNNDTVSHQVYSFSAAKKFQLPLYKGTRAAPVTFDRPGLVVLGCNIHDEMAGYIYVTDAPAFGTTGDDGTLLIRDLAAGDYRIAVWSPLVADPPTSLERTVHVGAQDRAISRVQLTRELRARPEPRPRRGDWEY